MAFILRYFTKFGSFRGALRKIVSQSHNYGQFTIIMSSSKRLQRDRQLGLSNFKIFNVRNGQEGRTASLCQISSKSLELRPRYGDFRFFKMAPSWPFLRVILPNLVVSGTHCVKLVDKAITMDNLRLLRLVVVVCRGTAILDFQNLKFLTVGRVTSVELRHRAKFHRNRSNRGRVLMLC